MVTLGNVICTQIDSKEKMQSFFFYQINDTLSDTAIHSQYLTVVFYLRVYVYFFPLSTAVMTVYVCV